MIVEFAVTGSFDPNSDAAIKPDLAVTLFAAATMAAVGLLIGLIELVFLENLFRSRSFLVKIFFMLILYYLLMLSIIAITYPVAASLELKVPLWDAQVWQKFFIFLGSLVFFSTLPELMVSETLMRQLPPEDEFQIRFRKSAIKRPERAHVIV